MENRVHVFDPTPIDEQSRYRGVGRYLQLLKENFSQWTFSSNLAMKQFNNEMVFINPFFNFLQPPLLMKRIAKKQIAVIHDLIPLKYPEHFPAGFRGNINIFLNKLALRNYDTIVTDSEASKKNIIKILGMDQSKIKVIYPCLPRIFTNLKSQAPNPKQIQNANDQNSKHLERSNLFGTWNLELGNYCIYVGDATWNKNLVNLAKAIKIINVPCVFVGKVFEGLTLDAGNLKVDNEDRNSRLENPDSNLKFQDPVSNFKHRASGFTNLWQQEFHQFLKLVENDKRFIFAGFIDEKDC